MPDGIVFDIETTGFNPRKDELLCVGYEESKDKIVVAAGPESIADFSEFLYSQKEVNVIGANLSFDIQWFLSPYEIPLNLRTYDVQFLHYLVDENYPIRTLKHLALLYTPYEEYEVDYDGITEIPKEELYAYNAIDVAATRAVFEGICDELDSLGIRSAPIISLMARVQPILAAMQFNGIEIDTNRLDQVIEQESNRVEELTRQLRAYPGAEGINLNSPAQLSKFLFETLGIEKPEDKDSLTATGSVSTKKSVLQQLDDPSGFVSKLLELKNVRDNLSKYVVNIKKHLEGNRVYPNYRLYKSGEGGTETGRLAIKDPPIHNIPRDHVVREAFVPYEGHEYIVQGDLAQAELCGLACFAQDEELRQAIIGGEDLHQWMANEANELGINISRQEAKTVNFGILYGVTPRGLVNQTSIRDIDKARAVIDIWFDRFQAVRDWKQDVEEFVDRYNYIQVPSGRRRNFPAKPWTRGERYSFYRKASNFPIQSWASDVNLILLEAICSTLGPEVNNDFYTQFPLTVIHDSIVWSVCDDQCLLELQDIYKYVMEEELPSLIEHYLGTELICPVSVELVYGKNWRQKEPLGDSKVVSGYYRG